MQSNPFQTESKFIEKSRIALTNAESNEVIRQILSEYGMTAERIAEGWIVFNTAKDQWEANMKEDVETDIASNSYKTAYSELMVQFKQHRDIARIYFKKSPDILVALGVKGRFPSKYNVFFDKVKQFYQAIKDNSDIQSKMTIIKVTPEIVEERLNTLSDLLSKRASYEQEEGESQEMTKTKELALLELKDWMEDFDSVAKVALYNQPQSLEVLGIFVRS